MRSSTLLPLALLAALTTARTDLSGCTSSTAIADGGASIQYYVPGTGEICQFLDCGGGRAPPMTDVPGCLQYSGTASYSPSFLPNFPGGQGGQQVSSTASGTGTLYTPPSIITSLSSLSAVESTISSSASAAVSSSLSSVISASSSSTSSSNSASSSSLTSGSSASTVTSITKMSASSSASGSGSATSAAASTTSSSGARATVIPQGVLGAVFLGLACIL